jgi:glycosyltransferase involved in cell wall biosynthesis
MKMKIDHWSTGYRGDIVQRPLVEACLADGRLNQRIVYCGQTPALAAMQALPIKQCHTAGTGRIRDVPLLVPKILQARKKLKQFYAESNGPRLVHITMPSVWDQFYIDIPKRYGARILVVVHDAQQHVGEEKWFEDWSFGRVIKTADHVAVLTPYAQAVLQSRLGHDTTVHLVSPGLVMDSSTPGPAKFWPEDRPLRFLFFGRIHAYKGLDILLDAWAQFRAMAGAPSATLSIVGSGNFEQYQAQIAATPDVTTEFGWVSDDRMAEVFATHDVNMLPYREGSESATALAGMWAGMPAIATDIGCFKEKLFHEDNALLTDVDAASIAQAIFRIATDHVLYGNMASATERVAHSWSAAAVAANWIAFYERIFAGKV